MPVPDPDHLLDQAERLIASRGGSVARQVDLRRAISSAYYALFHTVATGASDDLVGRTHRHTARYQLVYRSVEHRSLLRLCTDVSKTKLPEKYANHQPQGGFGSDLLAFADTVVELQEKRNRADYDPGFRAVKSEVVLDIARGRAALAHFRNASRSQQRAFVSLIVFSPR
jgi:hypothetical protein